MKLINPIDRKEFKKTFLEMEPYPHFCIDNFLEEEFANEVYESFPAYQEAQKLGKEFSAVNEKKKIQITDSSKFPAAIKKLNDLLSSQEYVDMWSELTGVPNLLADAGLVGGGIHETNSGGHLDVHVDFNFNEENQSYRRLNILIYFNKDWKEEYGGYLDVWDNNVKKRYGYFEPKFNRACGFLTSEISFHGVTPLTCPPDVMRRSFATYYYTKEMPEGWAGSKHTTIFKARPEEWAKSKILMPAERLFRGTKKFIRSAKDTIKSIIK
ncbi:MAG: 2OG-Fe(II) oxygenase [Methylophaga sp.]|nr:2OG-Fe(II) oxygenase [Methylophaga sp.]